MRRSDPSQGSNREQASEEAQTGSGATAYRGLTARFHYLGQDGSGIQYAVKELCRNMSCPTRGDWKVLKRLSRYLLDKVRARTLYKYQTHFKRIQVWVDTDYAGCKKTRKSTCNSSQSS